MLRQLEKSQYQTIYPLLEGEYVNVEVKAVAEGSCPGMIWVDRLPDPRTALVFCHPQEGYYFLGDPENDAFFENFYDTGERLAGLAAGLGMTVFECSGTSSAWETRLDDLLLPLEAVRSSLLVYRGCPVRCPQSLAADIVRLTAGVFEEPGFDTSFARTILEQWWRSLTSCLRQGAAFGAVADGAVVSLCYTAAVCGDRHWILGVDTQKRYRRRGLASAAAAAMYSYCGLREVVVDCDVMETNIPSVRLALKIGLQKAFRYNLYELPWGRLLYGGDAAGATSPEGAEDDRVPEDS